MPRPHFELYKHKTDSGTESDATAARKDETFARRLASVDKDVRDQAVKALSKWLSARDRLEKVEAAKLWKALFYCFWMSDKFPVQHALAVELCDLVSVVPKPSTWLWLNEFWQTIMREWIGIDRLRMDKYYMLLRIMMARTFRLLSERAWSADDVNEFVRVMSAGPLSPLDTLPSGIRRHISDLFIDELEKCVKEAPSACKSLDAARLTALLQPFVQLVTATQDRITVQRTIDNVWQQVLDRVAGARATPLPLAGPLLGAALFEAASDPAVLPRNRKQAYALAQRLRAPGDARAAQGDGAAAAPAAQKPTGSKPQTPQQSSKRKEAVVRVPREREAPASEEDDSDGDGSADPATDASSDAAPARKRTSTAAAAAAAGPAAKKSGQKADERGVKRRSVAAADRSGSGSDGSDGSDGDNPFANASDFEFSDSEQGGDAADDGESGGSYDSSDDDDDIDPFGGSSDESSAGSASDGGGSEASAELDARPAAGRGRGRGAGRGRAGPGAASAPAARARGGAARGRGKPAAAAAVAGKGKKGGKASAAPPPTRTVVKASRPVRR